MDIREALDNASLGHVEYMDWVRNNTRLILEELDRVDQIVNGYKEKVEALEERIEDLEGELYV
jgi:archaellum component FlaC